ncbi:SpaA isopeptide-forming pilin-related protein [Trueperella pyogenes]|uniref:SpaA isopeptide-forming pilin-related protein n=1 Tax=Trueperella pyogenes TaxID=1661 RepID=UPI0021688446|nr:SpaA isopeptide-forming pilin-related protein [Trueperella pyogenes]UVJ55572.1 SpaA isopeptide-forming pilin-related protein [Trueperella pyogenes]
MTNTRKDISIFDLYWLGDYAEAVYFSSTRSNVCNDITWTGDYKQVGNEYLLPKGGKATGTCKTTVTQNTTNKFDADVYDWYLNHSTATASVDVKMKYSEGSSVSQCDGLWFASGSPQQKADSYGVMGTIDLKSGYKTDKKLGFEEVVTESKNFPSEKRPMNGSAALAVDPRNPENVYYIPRLKISKTENYSPAGLWLYNAKTGQNRMVTSWQDTPGTARLGAAPDGALWAVAAEDGTLRKFAPQTNKWEKLGGIELGTIGETGYTTVKYTFEPGKSNSLESGDLAFDGLGNMWIIGSDAKTKKAFLFTISSDMLNGREPVKATMVGSMGEGRFNGIAFGPDGYLYGTTRDDDKGTGGLYLIDKTTGENKRLTDLPYSLEDLGSCSLPKPVLRIEKTADPTKGVTDGGQIEYTVTIENTGNLDATGVTFQDDLQQRQLDFVDGSATLNGKPWTKDFLKGPALVESVTAKYSGTVGAQEKAVIKFRTKAKPGQTKVCNSATVQFTGNPKHNGILTDDPNTPDLDDPTCTPVYTPAIGLDKKGVDIVATTHENSKHKTTVSSGDKWVRYLYFVSVDPNQPKGMSPERDVNGLLVENFVPRPEKKRGTEDLKDIKIADDQCRDIQQIYREGTQGQVNIGDRNGDGKLQPNETWQYECKQALPLDKITTNTATVTATSVQSQKHLEDKDTWTVEPVGFKVEKTAKVAGENGSVEWKPTGSPIKLDDKLHGTATYRVTVTNTGLVDTFAPTVKDVFTTPKGFVLDKLSWTEVDASNQATGDKPRENSIDLPKVRLAKGQSKTFEITADVHVEDANEVDWEKVGQCKTDSTHRSEYGLFNRVTMPHDDDGEDNNDACVPVTSPLLEMSVTKLGNNCDTDQQTCELPGASFSIYDADPASAGAKPLADGVVVDKDKPSRFTSKGLVAGTYWLVETAAPNGHVLMAEPVQFQLTFDGIKLLSTTANATVAENDKFNLRVVDQTAGELPKSGGNGHMPFIVAGVLLVLIGTIGYLQTSGCGPARVRNRAGSQQRI